MTKILTPFQISVLQTLAQYRLFQDFYLTGGTALSAYYLYHRYSEDLDLFTEVPQGVARVEGELQSVAQSLGARIAWGRRFQTLWECSLQQPNGEKLEMDFALDMPGRLQPIHPAKAHGVGLDNVLDIACNKVSALYERSEAKDFVDVYFIIQDLLPFHDLWKKTRQKYPTLDAYGLSLAFYKVKNIEKLPQMVKPITIQQLQDTFLIKAEELGREFGLHS